MWSVYLGGPSDSDYKDDDDRPEEGRKDNPGGPSDNDYKDDDDRPEGGRKDNPGGPTTPAAAVTE